MNKYVHIEIGGGAPPDEQSFGIESRHNEVVDKKLTSGTFFDRVFEQLGRPLWFLADTSFEGRESIPPRISVRDYLIIVGNLATKGPDPAYYVDYMAAGIPIYRGALDMGLRSAPDLLSALEFWCRHGSNRPGFLNYFIDLEEDIVRFRIEHGTVLGIAQIPLVETMLLGCATIAARCIGVPVIAAKIEMRHQQQAHAARLQEIFHSPVQYRANRDAISFPTTICRIPSAAYDEQLWQTASFQCAKEALRGEEEAISAKVESLFEHYLTEHGRVPRVYDIAAEMGLSNRTLVRKLRAEDMTFQQVVDKVLKDHSRILLADPALSIADVAERLGFNDSSGIYRRFRRWYGKTPEQVRQQLI